MEKGTRWRILQEVQRRGQASVADLTRSTGLNPTTVHHHLARLARAGLIRTEERRHGPGRPRLLSSLTPQGQEVFPQGYRWLAEEVLAAIAALDGPGRLDSVFRQVGRRLATRFRRRLDGKAGADRLREVQDILTEMGFDPLIEHDTRGIHLCNRHCPVWAAVQTYPQLCLVEHRFVGALLGAETRRIEHRLEDAPVCSYVSADNRGRPRAV